MNLTEIFELIDQDALPSTKQILFLLNLQDATPLYKKADQIRKKFVGDEIYLRGILEISNICRKNCNYCGIRGHNTQLQRYRMPEAEILQSCQQMEKQGITTVVLQAGEDPFLSKEKVGKLINKIRSNTNLAITLSFGEADSATYKFWRDCGMDRYLLRFETSDQELFKFCHPDDNFDERLDCIKNLQKLGIQTGSGFLIGIPQQTQEQLAQDIIFCSNLKLDMIGVGPFIPNQNTPFSNTKNPFTPQIFYKVVSLLRLLNKHAHLPSTTAFDAIEKNGRQLLLQRGANVFMPNITPQKYRKFYQLYPGKPCVDENNEQCVDCSRKRITSLGRIIGTGPGHSLLS